MSDFKAKIYQIRFRLVLCPKPCWVSLPRFPRLLAGSKGTRRREVKGKGKELRGGNSIGPRSGPPLLFCGFTPPVTDTAERCSLLQHLMISATRFAVLPFFVIVQRFFSVFIDMSYKFVPTKNWTTNRCSLCSYFLFFCPQSCQY